MVVGLLLGGQRLAQHHELVAADPGEDVRRPGDGEQPLGDCTENFVAGIVADSGR